MSDQVMHCMSSSLKQELLPKCWGKTEREERKESVCVSVCVCQKTHSEVGVSILLVEGGKDRMISQLCGTKACQLNALCSRDVALAVCGHMGCERGWEPPGDGPHATDRVSHRAGRILTKHGKGISTDWIAYLYPCRSGALLSTGPPLLH